MFTFFGQTKSLLESTINLQIFKSESRLCRHKKFSDTTEIIELKWKGAEKCGFAENKLLLQCEKWHFLLISLVKRESSRRSVVERHSGRLKNQFVKFRKIE